MIVDQLSNVSSDFYKGLLASHGGTFKLAERLMVALRFLQENDVTAMEPGTIKLDGDRVFAMIQHYDTRLEGNWEAHRKYIDVQYVAQGQEYMGYANLGHLTAGEYDPAKDFIFLEGEGSRVLMREGTFVILTPQDAHIPMLAVDQPQPVKKVVVKVMIADE
jgi:YhcH/YjgK/YiaL family protein